MRRSWNLLTLALAGTALAGGLALAQPPGGPGGHHGPPGPPDPVEAAARMSEALGLDEATTQTVEAILVESIAKGRGYADRMRAAFEAVKAERALPEPSDKKVSKLVHEIADLRAELELLKMRTGDEIATLLTPEQKERFDAFRRRRMAAEHGERPFGPPGADGTPPGELGPLFAPDTL